MENKMVCIENDFVKLWIEDGIIHEYFKPDIKKVTLDMAKRIVHDRLKLSNYVTMPIFIYSNNVTTMDKDARDYFATEESLQFLSASAMLVDNHVTWMLGKLFIAFNKPVFKSEIFKSNKKALEWLQQHKKSN